jgi:hypothetical protein
MEQWSNRLAGCTAELDFVDKEPTLMKPEDRTELSPSLEVGKRKPYKSPTLTLFGQVAQLTQNGTCAEANDNATPTACTINTGMGMTSDRRLKTDIVRIGEHPLGFGIYLFQYLPEHQESFGHGRRFGVMADEVEDVVPQAVALRPDGYKMVDYGLLGIRPLLH